MDDQQELDDLRSRIALLERENTRLQSRSKPKKAPRPPRRWLSALSALLIVVSVVVAPVAVLGTWARAHLVDTDRFAETVVPLAQSSAVQSYITDQVMLAVEENVDIDGLIDGLFSGLSELDLPPTAETALPLLQGPASEGVRSIIRTGVDRVIASPQFAQLWETVLRQSHAQAVAVLQNDPDSALELADDGTLSLRLDAVIAEVKTVLVDQGFGFAANIPEIERAIPLVQADELTSARAAYQVADAVGYVLPWVVLALLVAGVLLAKRRMRALAAAGVGFFVSFLTLKLGVGVGRWYTIDALSPDVMPSSTAAVVFDQVTLAVSAVTGALMLLSVIVAIGAWFASDARPAVVLRNALGAAAAAARRGLDRHGMHTRQVGFFVERWQRLIMTMIVLGAAFVLLLVRPVTASNVVAAAVIVLVLCLVIQLVRRSDPAPAAIEVQASN